MIARLFQLLFFFTPLIFLPFTSELFEFNKMIFVYLLTVIILAFWIKEMVHAKKFIFRRTILDIPLLVFLCSQFIASLFSLDSRTSFLGYYSRFNGGFTSILCYSLLYWALVTNLDKVKTKKAVALLLFSSLIVSLLGALEHFGINLTCKLIGQGWGSCWVQDVQNRVFATFGQPNWLAAFLVTVSPLAWIGLLASSTKKRWFYFLISCLFFLTLLFTKSRSGILGFFLAEVIFWGYFLIKEFKKTWPPFCLAQLIFVFLIILVGVKSPVPSSGPALEGGGTESGKIRQIVWKGALTVWQNYPLIGSGVETFAFSYPRFRPPEHNLVSEWDFIYNKAHNEFLNIAANSGLLGLVSYLSLIIFSLAIFQKTLFRGQKESLALAAGYGGLLLTNFFGFSVVVTSLLFFLYPALAISLGKESQDKLPSKNLALKEKVFLTFTFLLSFFFLLLIGRYWSADYLYNQGRAANSQKQYLSAQKYLTRAIALSSQEPSFHQELSQTYLEAFFLLVKNNQDKEVFTLADMALKESQKASLLSPNHPHLTVALAQVYLRLGSVDASFYRQAEETFLKASFLSPTDAKIFYNLGLIEQRLGEKEKAVSTLEKAIELKKDYQLAKEALRAIK